MRRPEAALVHAVNLAVLAVTAGATVAAGLALLIGSKSVGAGIAGGAVLSIGFAWITRVAMVRATAGPTELIGVYVLVSYAAKAVLLIVGIGLAARDEDVSRPAYAVTLLVGVIVSVLLQALLFARRDTETVRPVVTTPSDAYDDDVAVALARGQRAAAPTRNRPAPAGKVPPR